MRNKNAKSYLAFSFSPQISPSSRKLAANREPQNPENSVPRFMQNTISTKCRDVHIQNKNSPYHTNLKKDTQGGPPTVTRPVMSIAVQDLQNHNTAMAAKVEDQNHNDFTFKPKVSAQSTKLMENKESDFMTRQQQHLVNQKKYMDQATSQFKSPIFSLKPGTASKTKKTKQDEGDKEDIEKIDTSKDAVEGGGMSTSQSNPAMIKDKDNKPIPLKTKSSIDLSNVLEQSPYGSVNGNLGVQRQKSRIQNEAGHRRQQTEPVKVGNAIKQESPTKDAESGHTRSKTDDTCNKSTVKQLSHNTKLSFERINKAKSLAERAIKQKKIFTIHGTYREVRKSLRSRGWVEKFYKMEKKQKQGKNKNKLKSRMEKDDENDDDNDSNDDADKNDDSSSDDGDMDDDDDDDVADTKEKPWEEENGIYGIMSRIVRTADPTLIWSVRRDSVNYKYLRNNQIVNHYARAGSFTTKVGLCTNLRNVPWFDQSDPDAFFPRCYRLSHEEEKGAFIDDYRLTACMNIIRIIISRGNNTESSETTDTTTTSSPTLKPIIQRKGSISPRRSKEHITARTRKRKGGTVPQECAELALMQCEKFLRSKDHDDLDDETEPHVLSEAEWNEFIEWYYKVVHHDAEIEGGSFYAARSENLANRLRAHWPQFEMDGTKNVWIVKPGAKSRGRGIHCHDRLEEMLRLVNSQVVRKDSKFVVQKYIERPMLVYNTKFDIRQWFIVTDWNPLTLWFYKDCYLRFCSQEFTLDDFHEAIHLSNNAIQKNYDNGIRSDKLPDENMWFHTEFKEHLSKIGRPTVWDDVIYPGMKKAILCSLLTAQDVVECRKAAFELYGADFMITEDFQPWLIEINCSPSMDTSTKVTEVLCANVLDDTIKVVIDRRSDKNCDIGQFELCYKQPAVSVPPYCGSNFSVEGQTIKPPRGFKRLQALQNLEAEAEKLREKLSPPVSPDGENTYEKLNERPYLRTSRFGIGKTTPAPNPKETGSLMMSKPGKIIHQLHQKPKEKPIIKVQSTSVHQFRPEPSSKSPIPVPAGGLSIERKTVPLKRSNRKSVQSTEITQQQQFETDPSKQDMHLLANSNSNNLFVGVNLIANPLVDGFWARVCPQCGKGMNSRFSGESPPCKCRVDSIKLGVTRSDTMKSRSSSHDQISPVPKTPRRRAIGQLRRQSDTTSTADSSPELFTSRQGTILNDLDQLKNKIVLRYTDAGIQRPKTPIHKFMGPGFPNMYKKYSSRKSTDNGYPVYTDTNRPIPKGPLSMVCVTTPNSNSTC